MVTYLRFDALEWVELPGHPGALSKLLINPTNASTKNLDFRVSLYKPHAEVETHVHEHAEHVYFVISGRGLLTLDDESRVIKQNDTIFISPGVVHRLVNNGTSDLIFVLATSPPGELPLQGVSWSERT